VPSVGPLLLWDADLPHLWSVVGLVVVIGAGLHDRSQIAPQFLGGGPPHEVPAVVEGMDAQVGVQHEGVGVLALRLV
jgi:hypothetical protein